MRAQLLSFSFLMFCATPAFAISNDDVRAALEQRFKGDRTGACIAAGVIDDGTIATAYYCADPNSQRPYDEHTAFEIGSVTKTMTGHPSIRTSSSPCASAPKSPSSATPTAR